MKKVLINFNFFLLCMISNTILSGCMSMTEREYQTSVKIIDENYELVISTYPYWYARNETHVPFIYLKRVTDDYVALRFHISEQGEVIRKDLNKDTFKIHKFAYQINDESETILLRNFTGNSWSQKTTTYTEREQKGIPYQKGYTLKIILDLTINDEKYLIQEDMPAHQNTSFYPLFLYSALKSYR